MPSRHLVDPQLAGMIEQFPGFEFSAEALPAMRAMMDQMMAAAAAPDAAGVAIVERKVPGPKGAPEVPVIVYTPTTGKAPRAAVLHIHGGGYIMGTAKGSAAGNIAMARALGTVIVAVDYRLAPETAHPGPVEDCYAALKWLHAEAAALGVDPNRMCVSGESAGGGLAAATTLLARDRGEVKVKFQHLIFPMLDDRTTIAADPSPFFGQYIWSAASNLFGWTSLLGQPPGGPDVSHYAAPARASDLAGLPPTYIICGALDLFLEEDMEYARRLMRAGVPTEMHIYPGAPHAFQMIAEADVSQAYARDSIEALKKALA